MMDPTITSPNSIMPSYAFLLENTLSTPDTEKKIAAMRTLGVPYPEGYETTVRKEMDAQAEAIVQKLAEDKIKVSKDKEIIAMIAYLQRLGTDIKMKDSTSTK